MKIVMFTNLYLPFVGGVAQSVKRFTEGYRERDHRVIIVAPEFDDQPEHETDVIRIPAIQNWNGTDFSVALPLSADLTEAMDEFQPHVIHTHHPHILGATALRLAAHLRQPIVNTHHTRYEFYTHYVPVDSDMLRNYIISYGTEFHNLCDGVIAPSESMKRILEDRGVTTPIRVIPTGVDLEDYADGDGPAFRRTHGIPADAFLVGHVGRLAPEKNLAFLTRAVSEALDRLPEAHFVVIGDGDSADEMERIVSEKGVEDRAHLVGVQKDQDLVDGYHALDLFAFSSHSETQGMVLVEALAADCPLIALDAPGAREVVQDKVNGRLLMEEDEEQFAAAIVWVAELPEERRRELREAARRSAEPFDTEKSVDKTLDFYRELYEKGRREVEMHKSEWSSIMRAIKQEWELWMGKLRSLSDTMQNLKEERRDEEEE